MAKAMLVDASVKHRALWRFPTRSALSAPPTPPSPAVPAAQRQGLTARELIAMARAARVSTPRSDEPNLP